jgi:DNA polymerase II large subunit
MKGDNALDLKDKGCLKDKSWRELCEAASREHDPEKLLELITALNDVLEQREKEEKAKRKSALASEQTFGPPTANIVAA